MILQPSKFNPRQWMISSVYELQYKRDTCLQHVELHHHDFYEIFFLVPGDITYTIESKLYHVMPGDLLLINPKELHQVHIEPAMDAYERYVLWVSPLALQHLSTERTDLSRCFQPSALGYENQLRPGPNNARGIQRFMETLYRETQIDQYGADLMRTNLLTQLFVTINRFAFGEDNFWEKAIRTSKPVSEAIAYINQHYCEPLSLNVLAEQVYVSKYHLSHEFQRLVGTSVYRYIQKKRLLIARQLLSGGVKPSDVSSACGFGDYVSFYRAFKSEYGVSPREYISESLSRPAQNHVYKKNEE